MESFKKELCDYDWSDIYIEEGTNNKYSHFINVIIRLHNTHFPLINIKVNQKSECKPWISKAILNSIRKKNTMYI